MDIRSTDKLKDIKIILTHGIREVSDLGQLISGALYKLQYYNEELEPQEIEMWLNDLNKITNIMEDAIGVANE